MLIAFFLPLVLCCGWESIPPGHKASVTYWWPHFSFAMFPPDKRGRGGTKGRRGSQERLTQMITSRWLYLQTKVLGFHKLIIIKELGAENPVTRLSQISIPLVWIINGTGTKRWGTLPWPVCTQCPAASTRQLSQSSPIALLLSQFVIDVCTPPRYLAFLICNVSWGKELYHNAFDESIL